MPIPTYPHRTPQSRERTTGGPGLAQRSATQRTRSFRRTRRTTRQMAHRRTSVRLVIDRSIVYTIRPSHRSVKRFGKISVRKDFAESTPSVVGSGRVRTTHPSGGLSKPYPRHPWSSPAVSAASAHSAVKTSSYPRHPRHPWSNLAVSTCSASNLLGIARRLGAPFIDGSAG